MSADAESESESGDLGRCWACTQAEAEREVDGWRMSDDPEHRAVPLCGPCIGTLREIGAGAPSSGCAICGSDGPDGDGTPFRIGEQPGGLPTWWYIRLCLGCYRWFDGDEK